VVPAACPARPEILKTELEQERQVWISSHTPPPAAQRSHWSYSRAMPTESRDGRDTMARGDQSVLGEGRQETRA